MGEEDFREEEREIEELRHIKERLVRDIIRETKRDMDATLREVEDKYTKRVSEEYKVDRKIFKEKKERARRRY